MVTTFVVEKYDSEDGYSHDFSFHLAKAVKYYNGFKEDLIFSLIRCMDDSQLKKFGNKGMVPESENLVPVGSLEFVNKFMYIVEGLSPPLPINIPKELDSRRYTKRCIEHGLNLEQLKSRIDPDFLYFIKSETKYKAPCSEVIHETDLEWLDEDDTYMISDIVHIDSEWRAFIFRGQILDIKRYQSEGVSLNTVPDMELIQEMVDVLSKLGKLNSYTLDVGVNKEDGTFILEIHPFVSCGLYGFEWYDILPQMFLQGYKDYKNYD